MKKTYQNPTISCLTVNVQDVLTASLQYKEASVADNYNFKNIFNIGNEEV